MNKPLNSIFLDTRHSGDYPSRKQDHEPAPAPEPSSPGCGKSIAMLGAARNRTR